MSIPVKNLSAIIDFISCMQDEVSLSSLPFPDRKANLKIDGRSLLVNFMLSTAEALNSHGILSLDEFRITNHNGAEFVVPDKCGFLSGSITLSSYEENQPFSISFSKMVDRRWNENRKYYYRILLPIESVYWSRDIRTFGYQYGTATYGGVIYVDMDDEKLQVFPVFVGNQRFMAIESTVACLYFDMQKYIYAISLSLGLITSIVTFDYAYMVASDDNDFNDDLLFGFEGMRPSIKGQQTLFTTNIYSLVACLKRNGVDYALSQLYDGENIKSNMQDWIQPNQFNNIVKMLYKSEDLARAVLIIIEASTMPLDYCGAMSAVALETICSVLDKSSENPFIVKEEWDENVKPKFEALVSSLKSGHLITEEHEQTIIRKINGLNQRTNSSKLSTPFLNVGYTLSPNETSVIDKRNRFLHGHIIGHSFEESYQEILYAALELQKLCAILLLKYSGFNGYIVNNAVLMGLDKAVKAEEPVLVKC